MKNDVRYLKTDHRVVVNVTFKEKVNEKTAMEAVEHSLAGATRLQIRGLACRPAVVTDWAVKSFGKIVAPMKRAAVKAAAGYSPSGW